MENKYVFKNVMSSGLNVGENTFFKDVFDEKPFILQLDGIRDLKVSLCSCGKSFDNKYKSCPKCGTENFYYVTTDTIPSFRKLFLNETENGFKLKIVEFEAWFDFANIYIENNGNEAEFEFSYENSSYFYESGEPFRSFYSYDLFINDEFQNLQMLLQIKYNNIYKILEILNTNDLEKYLKALYLLFNYKFFRGEFFNYEIIRSLLNNAIRNSYFDEETFKNSLKDFDLNANSIEGFLKISNIDSRFDELLKKLPLSNLSTFKEFFSNLSDDNISYVSLFLEQYLLDLNSIFNFMSSFRKTNANFNTFLRFIFACSYNEDKKVSDIVRSFDRCLAYGAHFDYTKIYKISNEQMYKSRSVLISNEMLSEEDFDFICNNPSLNNFINVLNKKLL